MEYDIEKILYTFEDDYNPSSMVPGPRNMYNQGQLVQPNADGSRPGYAGDKPPRFIYSENYKGVFTEPAGPRKPKQIKFRINYIDNDGKTQNFYSKNYPSQATAYKAKLKKMTELEKNLNIEKGSLNNLGSTMVRKHRSYLPKNKKNYIHNTQLAELLDLVRIDPGYSKAGAKSTISKVAAKILDETTVKTDMGRNVTFYKKPTNEQINTIKEYLNKRTILPETKNKINLLQKDKYTLKLVENKILPMKGKEIDPVFLKHVNKNYGSFNSYINALLNYTKALDGEMIVGLNDKYLSDGKFKNNKKLANQIRNSLLQHNSANTSSGFFSKLKTAMYQTAMSDLTAELGNKNITYGQFKDRIRSQLNNVYKLKGLGLEIDELIGVSSSFRNQTAPYSVFTQITTEALNQGVLKDYQKVLSNHTAKLKNEINKNSKFVDGKWFHSAEAKKIVKNFNENVIPNLKNIDQLKGTNFSIPEMTLGSPTDKTLGGTKGRLATLEKAGLNFKEFYKKEGFGYRMPQGVLTQKELLKELPNLKKDLLKLAGTANKKCKGLLSYGGRAGLAEGLSPEFCINEGKKVARDLVAKNIKGSPAQNSIMKRVTSGVTNFAKSILDPKELFDFKKQFLSKGALIGAVGIDAIFAADDALRKNMDPKEAFAKTLFFGNIPSAAGFTDNVDVLNAKKMLENPSLSSAGKEYAQLIIDSINLSKGQSDTGIVESFKTLTEGPTNQFKNLQELKDKVSNTSTSGRFDYENALAEMQGTFKAKPKENKFFFDDAPDAPDVTPLTNKLATPAKSRGPMTEKKKQKVDLTPTTYENYKPYSFTKKEFEDTMRQVGALKEGQVYNDDFYKGNIWNYLVLEEQIKIFRKEA
jgi:hypothetical protein